MKKSVVLMGIVGVLAIAGCTTRYQRVYEEAPPRVVVIRDVRPVKVVKVVQVVQPVKVIKVKKKGKYKQGYK